MPRYYGASVHIARLYECVSAAGNTYFRGRLGLASIALLESNEVAPDGNPVWNLLLTEPPTPKREAKGGTNE